MTNEIIKNLAYLNEEDINNLKEYLDSDINNYIIENYNKLFLEWKKENSNFDIPSGIISICINDECYYINVGEKKYDENTLFDIASMSKLYTEFILFDIIKENNLSLDMNINLLVKDLYPNLKNITLFDLIKFNNTFKTKIDIRECKNRSEGLDALRSTYIEEEKKGYYLYSDIPVMILTDILETYTGLSYYELFDKYIIKKYDLHDTYLELNDEDMSRYVSINGKYVNDPKANVFGGYYGHAGVKASSKDFIKFLSMTFKTDYDRELFINPSETLNDEGKQSINKAIMGNLNICVPKYEVNGKIYSSLAGNYLPKTGFAIQGSVRCHGETCVFNIDGKEYIATTSILLDIYTEYDQCKKYEKETEKVITKEYELDEIGKLKTIDIRTILPYKNTFRALNNCVGIARLIALKNRLEK